jgi:hypothetical protein
VRTEDEVPVPAGPTPEVGDRRGGRILAATVGLMFAMLGTAFSAAVWWIFSGPPEDHLVADEQRLAQVTSRLTPVLRDFDAVVLVEDGVTSTGPATIEPCSSDSGQIHEPYAVRVWTLPTSATGDDALYATPVSRAAALSVAQQLRDRGWRGGLTLTPGSWTELSLRGDGYTVTATVRAYGDAVHLTGVSPPAGVCS